MERIKKLLSFLSPLPYWLRLLIVGLFAAIVAVVYGLSLTSCGQISKVTVTSTTAGVTVQTTQHKQDSTATSITVNPTFHYNSSEL